MSHCPYLVTCPDITFTLFMQAGLGSVQKLQLEGDLLHAVVTLALRLNGLLLGPLGHLVSLLVIINQGIIYIIYYLLC